VEFLIPFLERIEKNQLTLCPLDNKQCSLHKLMKKGGGIGPLKPWQPAVMEKVPNPISHN
jgi:hypothetical protein